MITIDTKTMTRESYIAFRKQWRADYKDLSNTIREVKHARKEHQRAGEASAHYASQAQSSLHYLRLDARAANANLIEAKTRAKELRSQEVARAA